MALDFELDYVNIAPTPKGPNKIEVEPKFLAGYHDDIMIRGGDFYAAWDPTRNTWTLDENDVIRLIDILIKQTAKQQIDDWPNASVLARTMIDCDSGSMDKFHKYVQKQCRDHFVPLDTSLTFANTERGREDYCSKRLPYALEQGTIDAWEELLTVLYAPSERHKIEWCIGAIVSGDSKLLQKAAVLYGPPGTGKSTVLDLISDMFDGYWVPFDSERLGNRSNQFALEDFRSNPLIAICQDGDFSKIETNAILNSLISHDTMSVNVKNRSSYPMKFISFLFAGTNKPVKITDAKSGMLRRLIDIHPTGNKVSKSRYNYLKKAIHFEFGAIAWHCLKVYEKNKRFYDNYVPNLMMSSTNPFYNFIVDKWEMFDDEEDMTLDVAYRAYKDWCEEGKFQFQLNKMLFKDELKNYYEEFIPRDPATGKRNVYRRFNPDKFENKPEEENPENPPDTIISSWIELKKQPSLLDLELAAYKAQIAKVTKEGTEIPSAKWEYVTSLLKDIDTSQVHYVLMPTYHIVIDFDLKDEEGRKSLERNIAEASKWPKTYCEVSKGGAGLHLHYLYSGDPLQLARIYKPEIEIKVFTGNSSLRRRLSLCNDIPIATISSNLPKKEVKEVVHFEGLTSERALRTVIENNLMKKYMPGTKPSMDFIKKALDDMYASGVPYDVSDMYTDIFNFAVNSTHQSKYCLKLLDELKLQSEESSEPIPDNETEEAPIVFYDVEVFPNLFVICWKFKDDISVHRMINPTPEQVEQLFKYRLVGFNNRDYDNHIVWARSMKYSIVQLYNLSQAIINGPKGSNARIREAYNLSYTDIFDYSSNKQSLKKWEIELGIHHQELGLPWDQQVPEHLWAKVAEYCCNDVIATEAVWNATHGDWIARQMLVALCHAFGCPATVNDKTNTLTQRIIFGNDKSPQFNHNWRDISKPVIDMPKEQREYLVEHFPKMMEKPFDGPLGPSLLPYWSTYKYDWDVEENEETGKKQRKMCNLIDGYNVGKGGLVMANWGIYGTVWTFDVASMHPSSAEAEYHFGRYTKRFSEIKKARILIKHKDYDTAKLLLDGVLAPFLESDEDAKAVAQALKIAINAVYGLTSAGFENAFRDPRNDNNIIALRGALFMFCLKHEVEDRGYTVVHIKTDSIKVADPDQYIYDFIMEYGERFGYTFEIEHKFEKLCLVNNAVYIGKLAIDDEEWLDACAKTRKKAHAKKVQSIIDIYELANAHSKEESDTYQNAKEHPELIEVIEGVDYELPTRWTATGTQFAVPFVFKTLFSHDKITFDDLCCTFSTKSALYLDTNEHLGDPTEAERELDAVQRVLDKAEKLGGDTVEWKRQTYVVDDLIDRKIELEEYIQQHHEYHFIGKVGQFVPVVDGKGGGYLKRDQNGKMQTVGGAEDYRWMESEMVRALHLEDHVDLRYFNKLVDKAINAIAKYDDPELFCA